MHIANAFNHARWCNTGRTRMQRKGLLCWVFLAVSAVPASPADRLVRDLSADPALGKALYENHCRDCHESGVHIRERRRAMDIADIDAWVQRWAEFRQLGWTAEEVQAVRDYLNREFYRY